MLSIDEDLPEALRDEVGKALRLVVVYDRQQYEFQHLREDLLDDYTTEELEKALDQLEIEGMAVDHFERFFHLGALDSMIYGFDRALVFQFPADDFLGLIVSIDRDIELNPESIISICSDAMHPSNS